MSNVKVYKHISYCNRHFLFGTGPRRSLGPVHASFAQASQAAPSWTNH